MARGLDIMIISLQTFVSQINDNQEVSVLVCQGGGGGLTENEQCGVSNLFMRMGKRGVGFGKPSTQGLG